MSAQEMDRGLLPRREALTLVFTGGRAFEVRDGDVVGRAGVGMDVLGIHEEISRRHAQFVRIQGTWYVIDLNSINGTFLDGKRIAPRERTPLRNGQEIRISPVFLATVRMQDTTIEEVDLPTHHDMAKQEQTGRKTMIILFADLKGSVDFFQEKGTILAQRWILNLYCLLAPIIASHHGNLLKNIGDAILAVFDDPHEAVRAALEMQAGIRRYNSKGANIGQYHLRVGMNMGTVIFENRDVFGNAVNIASRVQAAAPPEHIYITQRLYDEVKNDEGIQFQFISCEQLKGVRGKTPIYEIVCPCEYGKDNDGAKEAR